MARKLASIQKINAVEPIDGADMIEKIGILGWHCVAKKGEFQVGESCVYFEIDSLLPERSEFEFLRKSSWNEKLGRFRLKTVKLKGVISQGLAVPVTVFSEFTGQPLPEGVDVTEQLAVEKYEPQIPAQLAGDIRSFRWPIPKTDEERIQSNPEFIRELSGKAHYISVKLDGTSCSFVLTRDDDDELDFHVCSRNYSLKPSASLSFWQLEQHYGIDAKLREHHARTGQLLALQGEVVGPGIQKNPLGLAKVDIYLFNIVDCATGQRLPINTLESLTTYFGLKTVPIIERGDNFTYTLDELLEKAAGKYAEQFSSARPNQEREGIVVRSQDQQVSFKVVSNRFLLKGGE